MAKQWWKMSTRNFMKTGKLENHVHHLDRNSLIFSRQLLTKNLECPINQTLSYLNGPWTVPFRQCEAIKLSSSGIMHHSPCANWPFTFSRISCKKMIWGKKSSPNSPLIFIWKNDVKKKRKKITCWPPNPWHGDTPTLAGILRPIKSIHLPELIQNKFSISKRSVILIP